MLEKFVKQPRTPVITIASLMLTLIIALLLLALGRPQYSLIAMPGTALVLAAGVVLNGVAGIAASFREEYRGFEVAVTGIVLWFVIVAVFACQGRYW